MEHDQRVMKSIQTTLPPLFYTSQPGLKSDNLTRKVFLNALASFIDYGARVGVLLIVTPFLISWLGSTLFGVWQILNRLASFLSAADGRPTQALKWVIANYQSLDDVTTKRKAVSSAIGVWILFLPLVISIGIVLTWLSPSIVKAPPELTSVVQWACGLLFANLILSIFPEVPGSVLRGMNLGYKRIGVVAGLNVFGGALTICALYLDWGLIGVVLAQLCVTTLNGILFFGLAKKFVSWFGLEWVSWKEVRAFLNLSFWYNVWNLVERLLTASDVIVLGFLLSASTVSIYVLTGYVTQNAVVVVAMMIGAAMPGLGGLVGKHEFGKVISLRNEMLWAAIFFSGVFGSMILLWNKAFLDLWVGEEYYAGPAVNLLLVLIALQFLLIRIDASLIDLTLNIRRKVGLGFAASLLSIALSVTLIPVMGIAGLCLGVLTGRLLLTVAYPQIIGAFWGVLWRDQIVSLLRPMVATSLLLMTSTYLGSLILVDNWMEFVFFSTISFSLVTFMQWYLGFSGDQKQRLAKRGRLLLQRVIP
jgi:O-antigen/teichoic acid export membrane protein